MTASPFVFDATRDNFSSLVLDNSNKGPVLVNYWSAKAGPCFILMPRLVRLCTEYQGKFLLVMLNTDEWGALAREHGVTSVPTVKIFVNGDIVYTIHGAQPDVQLRSILDRYVARPSDALRPEALRAYQEGDKGKAFDIFAQAYHADPANTRIVIDHAKLLILDNQFEAVLKLLTTLPRAVQDMPEIALLSAHAQFMHVAANAPLKEILIRQINVHPEDMEARYQLSALLLIEDDYEGAMEQLLEIVRRDRTYKMDAGRKGLLAVFTILGENHDLVARYRSLLYQALQP